MTQRLRGADTLAADLDRGFSLPASWYTDPNILALERERIFRHTWQYVGQPWATTSPAPSVISRSWLCAAKAGSRPSSTCAGTGATR